MSKRAACLGLILNILFSTSAPAQNGATDDELELIEPTVPISHPATSNEASAISGNLAVLPISGGGSAPYQLQSTAALVETPSNEPAPE